MNHPLFFIQQIIFWLHIFKSYGTIGTMLFDKYNRSLLQVATWQRKYDLLRTGVSDERTGQ